jgi:hypothetical protein
VVRASWNRRTGRLTLRLRGLAARARVRLGGRTLRVRRGVAIAARTRPGSALLLVSARSTSRTRVRPTRHRVVVTPGGRVRVRAVAARGPTIRPAARSVRVVLDRDRGLATFTLAGLAPRARVRLGGRRLALSGRLARVSWTGTSRAVLVVTAPSTRRVRVARVRYRVTLPADGAPVLRRL